MGATESGELHEYSTADLKNLKVINKFTDPYFGMFYNAEYNDDGFVKKCMVKDLLVKHNELANVV
jgi:hypothetical protein